VHNTALADDMLAVRRAWPRNFSRYSPT